MESSSESVDEFEIQNKMDETSSLESVESPEPEPDDVNCQRRELQINERHFHKNAFKQNWNQIEKMIEKETLLQSCFLNSKMPTLVGEKKRIKKFEIKRKCK